MISLQEKERLVKIVNQNHHLQKPELSRAGYCVITGYYDSKTLAEICAYYMVGQEDAMHWWNYFGFNSEMSKTTKKKRKDKANSVVSYLKDNVGNEITANDIAENCSISLPTVYKFINDNAGWFKKVKRGLYEVVDAEDERRKAKAK